MSTEKAKAKQIQVDANAATPAGSLQELIETRKILPAATTVLDGAMSKEDKVKLQDLPTNSELVSILDDKVDTLDSRIMSEVADITSDLAELSTDKYDKTGGNISGDVSISGKLTVHGGMAEVEAEHVSTSDTIIRLNDGEVGTGVTSGFAGVEIDRGTEIDYEFGFNETTELFEVGKVGDRQPLLTRMLAPVANKFFRWNDTTKQAETADITWGDVTGKLSDVSKAEAETGTGTDVRFWSSLRVREAILGWWNSSASKTKIDGIEAGAQVNTVTYVAGKTGAVSVTKTDVGLSNAANTSDAAKPVSTAQQAALNLKADKSSLGTAATRNVGTGTGNVMEVGAFGLGRLNSEDGALWDESDKRTGFFRISPSTAENPFATTSAATISWSGYGVGGHLDRLVKRWTGEQYFFQHFDGEDWGTLREIHHTGNILQTTGTSTEYPMSQKAVTDAIADIDITASLGTAATKDVGESAGNVMEVGAFGWGGSSLISTSYDTEDPSSPTRVTIFPVNTFGAGTGSLVGIHLKRVDQNSAVQIGFNQSSGRMYFRTSWQGDWGLPREVLHSATESTSTTRGGLKTRLVGTTLYMRSDDNPA